MSSRKTSFQDKWLSKIDPRGDLTSLWAQKDPKDKYSCCCRICNTSFTISKGFSGIKQHAETDKHGNNLFKIRSNQTVLVPPTQTNENSTPRPSVPRPHATIQNGSGSIVSLYTQQDAGLRAELFFIMDLVANNQSANSCQYKKELFLAMFPTGVPESFSLSPSKVHYVTAEALGPYFQQEFLTDLQQPNVKLVIQFDDTSNSKKKKELQVRVSYWSKSQNKILNIHLVTYFIPKGDAQTIFDHLLKSLIDHNLSERSVLALGCDGPNVNKAVIDKFNRHLDESGSKKMFNLGTCLLHVVNNTFIKGVASLPVNVSDFVIKIFYFIDHSDNRGEILEDIQEELNLPLHHFTRHSTIRWLTLGAAADRALEQWPAIQNLFLVYIPQYEKRTLTGNSYINLLEYVENPLTKPCLEFVSYLSKIFTREFTLLMQKNEPLIHILHTQLTKLVYTLLTLFLKKSAIPKRVMSINTKKTFEDKTALLDLKNIKCGTACSTSLESVNEDKKEAFLEAVQKCYPLMLSYLLLKVKDLSHLKYFECLSPEKIRNSMSGEYICEIAKLLPLNCVQIDTLSIEWSLLQVDENVTFSLGRKQRIDDYWSKIFCLKSGNIPRYSNITHVVKASLSLVHGSADVERGFSKSGKLLTKDKSKMSERTLNAKLAIVEGLKQYDMKSWKVPITHDLLLRARRAHSSYVLRREQEEKEAAEKAKRKRLDSSIREADEIVLKKMKTEVENIKSLDGEIESARKQYNNAVKDVDRIQKLLSESMKSDEVSTNLIKEIIRSLENLRTKEKTKRERLDQLVRESAKRKSKVCETVLEKKNR